MRYIRKVHARAGQIVRLRSQVCESLDSRASISRHHENWHAMPVCILANRWTSRVLSARFFATPHKVSLSLNRWNREFYRYLFALKRSISRARSFSWYIWIPWTLVCVPYLVYHMLISYFNQIHIFLVSINIYFNTKNSNKAKDI